MTEKPQHPAWSDEWIDAQIATLPPKDWTPVHIWERAVFRAGAMAGMEEASQIAAKRTTYYARESFDAENNCREHEAADLALASGEAREIAIAIRARARQVEGGGR